MAAQRKFRSPFLWVAVAAAAMVVLAIAPVALAVDRANARDGVERSHESPAPSGAAWSCWTRGFSSCASEGPRAQRTPSAEAPASIAALAVPFLAIVGITVAPLRPRRPLDA